MTRAENIERLAMAIRAVERGHSDAPPEMLRAMRRVHTHVVAKAAGHKTRPPWCECPRCPECGSATVVVEGMGTERMEFRCSERCGPLRAEALSRGQIIKAKRAQWCWEVAKRWGLA